MKGLFKRKNAWWIRFTPANGAEQLRLPLGTSDEAEALIRAREIVEQASREAREQMESSPVEIINYLNSKRKEGLSESTLSSRHYVLHSLVAFLDARTPRHITYQGLQRWFEHHRKTNPHTAVAYLNIAHFWFLWLVEKGKMPSDITTSIKVPKLPMRRRRQFLLPLQAQKLLDAADDKPGLKFAIYCGLHAGMRKLEIIEARPNWFDLDAGLIHIQATETFQPKDRDNRTVPMTNEFKAWLLTSYGIQEPFMLEPKAKHSRYRYRYDFRKIFDKLADDCGLDWLTFHDLRRTFASLHVSRGTSIYKVARWLGDGVDVVEKHYGHLIPQDSEINKAWTRPAN
jgi:hypothetical protein